MKVVYFEEHNLKGPAMTSMTEVLDAALKLQSQERAAVAQQLLASLDELSEAEAAELWAEEAQQRLEQYRAGITVATEAKTVHANVESCYR